MRMALTATLYNLHINLSDIDRGVYEDLDLRIARHPSESPRFMWTRTIAYCLSHAEGIAFSKDGIASTDDPPIAIRDPTGILLEWIDVGTPAAERLHKATKAARQVSLFTAASLTQLRRDAAGGAIHKADTIAVWLLEPAFLDALEARLDRKAKLELVRTDGRLYVSIGGDTVEGAITRDSLVTA
ncbi:YaeQ family protein [Nannocystis bainbridge]|uniref:YaeQ family protein n=1 Tax=Nannocystis bainbridge TaxID=2995303 RepID=A0ABT5E0D2_9BACT|nr:YaeQ family protein [Nannocystis bainbridge]MDC0718880.1 YaeQ family protein [Nannocystis bainbridge]